MRLQLLLEGSLETALNGIHVLVGGDIVLALRLASGKGKILGHDTVNIDSVNASLLKALSKGDNLGGVVELATLDETTGPGEDGGNGVGGGLVTLLVLTVVASDSTVGSLRLEGLAIRGNENRGHETKRAEALSDNVGLDITVVVLEGHDVTTGALDHLGDHVVNETVLVPDLLGLEVLLVGGLVDLLEDILESTIVLLEDGVLGAHVERELLVKSQLEGSVSETSDGLIGVVLGLSDTAAVLELEDLNLLRLATLGGVNHGELTGAGQDSVLGAVLVTKGVTANDDRLLPARNKTGNAGDDNGLTEDGTTKGISDGSVGGKPHLLQLELLDTSLIGGDGGTLDTDGVLLDSLGGINGDLIVGLITVLKTKIIVLEVDVEVRKDELILDDLPDDAGHLITVELDDGVLDLDLLVGSHCADGEGRDGLDSTEGSSDRADGG